MATTRNIKGDLVEEVPFQTIGGSGIPAPLKGSQGLITTAEAVAQEVKKGINDLAIVMTQGQAQSEKSLSNVAKILQDLKEVQVAIAREDREMSSVSGITPQSPRVPSGEVPAPRQAPQIISSGGYSESRRQFSVGNVRQALGARLSDRLDDWEYGESDILRTPDGGFRDATTGRFVSPSDPAVQKLMQQEMITSAVRGGAQSLAEGKSVGQAATRALGAIPGGANLIKGLGVAGAGVAAIQMTTNFMEDQRAKNSLWQSQLGGTQMDAVGERFGQRMFGLGQMGFMGSEDAQRLYKEVAMTGLQGDERTQAQGFALQNYRSMGISIDESMKFVREAAKSGTDSLVGLSGALRRVSETARDAGVNAEQMRKNFSAAWTAANAATGTGFNSTLAAEATATMFGDSRVLAETDASGIFSDNMFYQISAQTGLDVAEVRLRASEDPAFLASQYDALTGQIIEMIAPGLGAFLRSMGITKVTKANENEVNSAVLRWAMQSGIGDPMHLHSAISSMLGINIPRTIEAVTSYLARAALGQIDLEEGIGEAEAAYAYQDVNAENRDKIGEQLSSQGRYGDAYRVGLGIVNLDKGILPGATPEYNTDLGGLAQAVVEDGEALGIKRLADAEGNTHGLLQLLRQKDGKGIDMINQGDMTVVGGENDGRLLTDVLQRAATPQTQTVDVKIGFLDEAKNWFKARFDSDWEPGDPHRG